MTTYRERFNKRFNQEKHESNSRAKITKLSGIPKKILDEVYSRGVGAFKTTGPSRPNMTKEQWGNARTLAFVMKSYKAREDGKDTINQDKDLYMKIKNKLK